MMRTRTAEKGDGVKWLRASRNSLNKNSRAQWSRKLEIPARLLKGVPVLSGFGRSPGLKRYSPLSQARRGGYTQGAVGSTEGGGKEGVQSGLPAPPPEAVGKRQAHGPAVWAGKRP